MLCGESHSLSGVSLWPMLAFDGEEEYNRSTVLCVFLPYLEVNQLVYPHIPSSWTSPPSHPSRSSQSTDLGFPLAVYVTHGGIRTAGSISQTIPFSPSPPCPHVHSLCLHLSSCPVNRFKTGKPGVLQSTGSQHSWATEQQQNAIFLDSTYVLIYNICFSLSDLFHSV